MSFIHPPHPNPRPHPEVHSSATSTYYSPSPPYRPQPVRAHSDQPRQLSLFICALILIFSSISSMLLHSLSWGQMQRLAVAFILSMEPDIIVLDEPTTGQDRGHLNKFLTRMKMLNEAGKTIILISHDMGVVAEYASRTIVMKDWGY